MGDSHASSKLWKYLYKRYLRYQLRKFENQKLPFFVRKRDPWNWKLCFKQTCKFFIKYSEHKLDSKVCFVRLTFVTDSIRFAQTRTWHSFRTLFPSALQRKESQVDYLCLENFSSKLANISANRDHLLGDKNYWGSRR